VSIETAQSASLRAATAAHRDALDAILERYRAANPRVFGSVARGDATPESDIDLLVDLMLGGGNEVLRVAGIAEELSRTPGNPRRRGGCISAAGRGFCEYFRVNPDLLLDIVDHQLGPLAHRLGNLS
jgi:predicted nucleotidyltransferase